MPSIHFIDVTNRDTVQASRISLAKLQKTMVNLYLSKLGVYQSEMGFPFTDHEHNYIKANLKLAAKGAFGQMKLGGWCRAITRDVEDSLITGVEHLNLSMSTSDQMIRHKFHGKLDREKIIKETTEAISYARKKGVKTVGVNAEDASRTDLEYLVKFAKSAKDAGADRIRYCDTLGYDSTMSIYHRIKDLAQQVGLPIEQHCHNDLGMAVANSVAGATGALDGGVDAYINTSINGLGERAGQADLLSCILAVKFGCGLEKYRFGDELNLKFAYRLARYVSDGFSIPIPINQPGVGDNAFAHESGIHADGALKDRRNYELYDMELLGFDEVQEPPKRGRVITTGEYGGLAGFKYVYSCIGISFPDDKEAEEIMDLVRYANAHTQKPLTDDELRFIASNPEETKLILTMAP